MEDEHFTSIGFAGEGPKYRQQAEDQVRINQAEVKCQSAARYDAINGRMESNIKSLLETGSGRDGMLEEIQEAETAGELATGIAQDYALRQRAAKETFLILEETKDKPLPDRLRLAASRLAPDTEAEPSPSLGYVLGYLEDDWKRFLSDPAEYVKPEVEKRLMSSVAQGRSNEKDETALKKSHLEASLQLQQKLGLSLGVPPRLVSRREAEAGKLAFNTAGVEGKVELLNQIGRNFDGYHDRVLKEMNLDWKQQVAAYMVWDDQSPYLARTLMESLSRNDFSFPEGITSMDVKNTLEAQLSENALGRYLDGRIERFPEVLGFAERRDDVREILERLTAQYVESGNRLPQAARKAVQIFTDKFQVLADENLGYMLIPPKHSPQQMAKGLEAVRDLALRTAVEYSKSPSSQLAREREETGEAQHSMDEQALAKLREKAIWVEFPPGVALVQAGTGNMIMGPWGKPYIFTIREIEAFGLAVLSLANNNS